MRTLDFRLEGLVNELLEVLDVDIAQVKLTLVRLDELKAAVIKRQEDELRNLLDTIVQEGVSYGVVETRRYQIRCEMAEFIGCSVEQMNLSKLCENLDGDSQRAVARKQGDLKVLMSRLKEEHKSTELLLKGCSKLNNMLMKEIFGGGRDSVTYNSRGNTSWEAEKGIVNFKL